MKIIIASLLLISVAICLLKCTGRHTGTDDPRGEQYAGAASCMQCHKDIVNNYMHANHYNTSSKVDFEKFKALVTASNDTVRFPNDQLVRLETIHNKIAQSYILNGNNVGSESMDLAFGSGEKAWTFGYWKGEELYELPLTYLTAMKRWTNSPGFPAERPNYSRLIVGRCMECHTSYTAVEKSLEQTGRYSEKIKEASIIYGIDCERCHGPAAQHVAFHTDNPQVKTAKFMTSIKSLGRQQQLDLCATCHSGDAVTLKSIFAFTPGDTLSQYYMYYPGAETKPDAHGMQMQSLMQSKCFQQSNLTCMSCHDAHTSERNNQQVFVQRCMSCHTKSDHAVAMQQINNYCINCHMPLQASKALNFGNSAEQSNIKYNLRTHRIAVYPQGM
ncbi:MAG: hypothetical protein J7539_18950 [Niabella sp.]|nr:hypothetical protein [Niabella sp.]